MQPDSEQKNLWPVVPITICGIMHRIGPERVGPANLVLHRLGNAV